MFSGGLTLQVNQVNKEINNRASTYARLLFPSKFVAACNACKYWVVHVWPYYMWHAAQLLFDKPDKCQNNKIVTIVVNVSKHVRGAPVDPVTTCNGRGWVGNITWATPLAFAEQKDIYRSWDCALLKLWALWHTCECNNCCCLRMQVSRPYRTPGDPLSCWNTSVLCCHQNPRCSLPA